MVGLKSPFSSKALLNIWKVKMLNTLPDLVLALIFGYLLEAERICTVMLVSRKWYDVIHSRAVWKTYIRLKDIRGLTSHKESSITSLGNIAMHLRESNVLKIISTCYVYSAIS